MNTATEQFKRDYYSWKTPLASLPKRIRSKMTGNILQEHTEEDLILNLHGGATRIAIYKGDYVAHNECQTREYIHKHLERFELLGD